MFGKRIVNMIMKILIKAVKPSPIGKIKTFSLTAYFRKERSILPQNKINPNFSKPSKTWTSNKNPKIKTLNTGLMSSMPTTLIIYKHPLPCLQTCSNSILRNVQIKYLRKRFSQSIHNWPLKKYKWKKAMLFKISEMER